MLNCCAQARVSSECNAGSLHPFFWQVGAAHRDPRRARLCGPPARPQQLTFHAVQDRGRSVQEPHAHPAGHNLDVRPPRRLGARMPAGSALTSGHPSESQPRSCRPTAGRPKGTLAGCPRPRSGPSCRCGTRAWWRKVARGDGSHGHVGPSRTGVRARESRCTGAHERPSRTGVRARESRCTGAHMVLSPFMSSVDSIFFCISSQCTVISPFCASVCRPMKMQPEVKMKTLNARLAA